MTDWIPGTRIGNRFVIEEFTAKGGQAEVFRAFDSFTASHVALKLFYPGAHGDSPREAAVLKEIQHPGVVAFVDAGWDGALERHYLALEWLTGHTLEAEQTLDPLTPERTIALGILLARALEALHRKGFVHRDLKPSNIWLRRAHLFDAITARLGADPVLIDLGIAVQSGPADLGGTAAYMSPEQAQGRADLDLRSDLYALGALLFELLAGTPPHVGPNAVATLAKVATTPAPRLSLTRAGIPRRLDDLVDLLLRTDRNERPASAAEVAASLEECLNQALPSAYPTSPSRSDPLIEVSRLVTTLVATELPNQERALSQLATNGAIATPLGGNAVVGHFGAISASGDEARTALVLARRLAKAGSSVGVATGRTRLARDGSRVQPVGEVVDRAAALAREAQRGHVLVDTTTSELGRSRYAFVTRGDGSSLLLGQFSQARGHLGGAPFVGREADLARILDAYDHALESRRNAAIAVSGPPGIGKSRLRREVVARLGSREAAPRIVLQHSESYAQKHVLGAAADVLRSLLGLQKGCSTLDAERALVEGFGPETWSDVSQDSQRVLNQLLSSDAALSSALQSDARDSLWLAMTDLVARWLSSQPLVLIFEDLQWADAESIQWIDHLMTRQTARPLFVLACVRPSFFGPLGAPLPIRHLVRIDLRPMSRAAVAAIAQSILGSRGNEQQIGELAEHSGGSPLFAEELARLALLGRSPVDAPTLEAAIQASLDALSPAVREACCLLSVLGTTVWSGAAECLNVEQPHVVLAELVAHEILSPQETSRFAGQKEYAFKHALIRDVAYAELSQDGLRQAHAKIGNWLATVGEDAATVAGHLDRGGQDELAAQFWERAASRALAAHALKDALTMAERALDFASTQAESFTRASLLDAVWARLDPRAAEREVVIATMERKASSPGEMARALGARARYESARGAGSQVLNMLERAEAVARALADWPEVDRTLAVLATRTAFAGDLDRALAKIADLLDPSRPHGRGSQVDGYQALAVVRQAQGAVAAALDARRRAISAAKSQGYQEREANLTTNLGFALSALGAREEARSALCRGFALADSIGSSAAIRHAQMNLLGFAALYGTDRELDALLGETRSQAESDADSIWLSGDRANLGILYYRGVELLHRGSRATLPKACALLERACREYRVQLHQDVLPVALGQWAEAERRLGRLESSRNLAVEGALLLQAGAPSLLNEAPLYLALYRVESDLGEAVRAEEALRSGMQPLMRRFQTLAGSPYARTFLTGLLENADLIAAASAAGLLPASLAEALS